MSESICWKLVLIIGGFFVVGLGIILYLDVDTGFAFVAGAFTSLFSFISAAEVLDLKHEEEAGA